MTAMMQGILPLMAQGIPDLDIPPFEPLSLGSMSVDRSEDQFITLSGNLSNIKVYGASNASVSAAHLDLNKKIMHFNLEIPKLRLNSSYNLKGNYFQYHQPIIKNLILIYFFRKYFAIVGVGEWKC